MNLVYPTEYTNMYLKAASIRGLLHEIFMKNECGFTSALIKYLRNMKYDNFSLDEEIKDIEINQCEGIPDELSFNYSFLGETKSSSMDIRNVYTVMYVDILNSLSQSIIEVIKYIYDTVNQSVNSFDVQEINKINTIYNFIIELQATTKSAITMLFDIKLYSDHFKFII